jgi:CRISPR-associated protein Cmr2
MNHEFHAQYPFALKDSIPHADTIDFLVYKQPDPPTRWTDPREIEDDWMRLMILSQAIAKSYKEQARMGMRREASGHGYWINNRSSGFLHKRLIEMKEINLAEHDKQAPSIANFPPGSWSLHVPLNLTKPYISRDDTDFYIIENPVKKEWVFKVPYIAPSQWKGSLRSAMVQELVNDAPSPEDFAKRRFRMAVLFGDENGEEPDKPRGLAQYLDEMGGSAAAEKYRQLVRDHFKGNADEPITHHRGILHFYPTYFDRIGLEVINPHDRETGAGKLPIYFECVPAGKESKGVFALLYVPLYGLDTSDEEAKRQAESDFEAVAKGIKAMMTKYGFGAKTSSGFGTAEVDTDEMMIIEPESLKPIWVPIWNNRTN